MGFRFIGPTSVGIWPRLYHRALLRGVITGAYQTAWRRFHELQEKGIWRQILQALLDWGYTLGKVKVEAVAVDSTRVEAKKGGKV